MGPQSRNTPRSAVGTPDNLPYARVEMATLSDLRRPAAGRIPSPVALGWSVVAVVVGGTAVVLGFQPFGPIGTRVFSDSAQEVGALFAVTTGLFAARRLHGRQRIAWAAMTLALLSAAVGNAGGLITYLTAGSLDLALNFMPVDFAPLLAIPFALVGAVALVTVYVRVARRQTLLDTFIAAGSVLMLAWVVILQPIVAGSHGDASNFAPAMADVVYLMFVLFIGLRANPADRLPIQLIILGQLINTLADMGTSLLQIRGVVWHGGLIETLWVAAPMVIGMSSVVVRQVPERWVDPLAARAASRSFTPYLAVIVAALAATGAQLRSGRLDIFLTCATVFVMILLSVRQYLALRDNKQLTDTIERGGEALRESEERFRQLVSHSSDIIAVVDGGGVVRYVTPAIQRFLGISVADVMNKPLVAIIHPSDAAKVSRHLAEVSSNAAVAGSDVLLFRMRDSSMTWHTLEATTTNMLSRKSVRGIVLNTRDITERHRLEKELRHQAFHDPLTGLANRALLHDRLSQALLRQLRSHDEIALVLIDLDDFKIVNDTLGHALGDELLRQTADRMDKCLRKTDTAARLGGDEFALLIESREVGLPVAEIARRVLRGLEQPLNLGDDVVAVQASAGIAFCEPGISAEELLRRADVAMYEAKRLGKGRYTVYSAPPGAALVDPRAPAPGAPQAIPEPPQPLPAPRAGQGSKR